MPILLECYYVGRGAANHSAVFCSNLRFQLMPTLVPARRLCLLCALAAGTFIPASHMQISSCQQVVSESRESPFTPRFQSNLSGTRTSDARGHGSVAILLTTFWLKAFLPSS